MKKCTGHLECDRVDELNTVEAVNLGLPLSSRVWGWEQFVTREQVSYSVTMTGFK